MSQRPWEMSVGNCALSSTDLYLILWPVFPFQSPFLSFMTQWSYLQRYQPSALNTEKGLQTAYCAWWHTQRQTNNFPSFELTAILCARLWRWDMTGRWHRACDSILSFHCTGWCKICPLNFLTYLLLGKQLMCPKRKLTRWFHSTFFLFNPVNSCAAKKCAASDGGCVIWIILTKSARSVPTTNAALRTPCHVQKLTLGLFQIRPLPDQASPMRQS